MRQITVLSLVLSVSFQSFAQQPATKTLPGYTIATSAVELDWEQKFRAIPEAART